MKSSSKSDQLRALREARWVNREAGARGSESAIFSAAHTSVDATNTELPAAPAPANPFELGAAPIGRPGGTPAAGRALSEAYATELAQAVQAPGAAQAPGNTVKAGRPVSRTPAAKSDVKATTGPATVDLGAPGGAPGGASVDPKLVRAWAHSQGIPVGVRGRIGAEVVSAYLEANGSG